MPTKFAVQDWGLLRFILVTLDWHSPYELQIFIRCFNTAIPRISIPLVYPTKNSFGCQWGQKETLQTINDPDTQQICLHEASPNLMKTGLFYGWHRKLFSTQNHYGEEGRKIKLENTFKNIYCLNHVCGTLHEDSTQGNQKRKLELDLQAVRSCLAWALGTELWSSERAISALTQRVSSPVPENTFEGVLNTVCKLHQPEKNRGYSLTTLV